MPLPQVPNTTSPVVETDLFVGVLF
jgi:hypothetical protein